MKKLHFFSYLVRISPESYDQNGILNVTYVLKRDQGPSETKKVDFVLQFTAYLKKSDRFAAEW